jgi:hypothetical protein
MTAMEIIRDPVEPIAHHFNGVDDFIDFVERQFYRGD